MAFLKVKGLDTDFLIRELLFALDLTKDFACQEHGVVDDGLKFGRGPDRFAAQTDGSDNGSGNDEDGVLATLFHS